MADWASLAPAALIAFAPQPAVGVPEGVRDGPNRPINEIFADTGSLAASIGPFGNDDSACGSGCYNGEDSDEVNYEEEERLRFRQMQEQEEQREEIAAKERRRKERLRKMSEKKEKANEELEGMGREEVAKADGKKRRAPKTKASTTTKRRVMTNSTKPEPPSEEAKSVMKDWLLAHYQYPYPTEAERNALAENTDITPEQVNYWFINARARIWRPVMNVPSDAKYLPKGSQKSIDQLKASLESAR